MKGIRTCLFILSSITAMFSQQNPPAAFLYDDTSVPKIDITIDADSLAFLLDDENRWSHEHKPATFIYENNGEIDTVENVGLRLRGNTSRGAEKKSWKISINEYQRGRKYKGVEKINLNGQHNDPSVARAKICSDILTNMNIPNIRANHVELYINGTYFGLYINTEHIDENYVKSRFQSDDGNLYKCTYPADLKYVGEDQQLYDLPGDKPPYELITNKEIRDYGSLIDFIRTLNTTPNTDLPCELEKVFDVDTYLQFIVFDILTANWDGPIYNQNNFYLYHNPKTGLIEYIPFDLDNTFGIDWFGVDWTSRSIYDWSKSSEGRPIYEKIMAVAEYRDRYSYYMQEAINGAFRLNEMTEYLFDLKEKLAPSIVDDTYYNATYGFTYEDFQNSYSESTPYFHTPIGIQTYIQSRLIKASIEVENPDIQPIVRYPEAQIDYVADTVKISLQVEDDEAIESVQIFYRYEESADYKVATVLSANGLFSIHLPLSGDDMLQYHIEAIDNAGQKSVLPRCDDFLIERRLAVDSPLKINEIMPSNNETLADEIGEFDDWLEVFNSGTESVSLENYYLTDDENNTLKWQFPSFEIPPSSYVLVWADNDEEQGDLHASFKLSSSGEFIAIFDSEGAYVDGFIFPEMESDQSYGRLPDGADFLTLMTPSPSASNSPLGTEQTSDDYFTIYPNPSADQIIVKTADQGNLLITNSKGTVFRSSNESGATSISVADYPAGIYTISFTGKNNIQQTQVFIKI